MEEAYTRVSVGGECLTLSRWTRAGYTPKVTTTTATTTTMAHEGTIARKVRLHALVPGTCMLVRAPQPTKRWVILTV